MFRRLSLCTLVFCGLVMLPGTVRADDKGHGAAADGNEQRSMQIDAMVHVEGGGEEPRIFNLDNKAEFDSFVKLLQEGHVEEFKKVKTPNIFAISWDLGLWTLVVFVLLLVVLRKVAWGPMLAGLQKREDNIKSALEEAKRSNEESQKLRGQMASQMAEAQEKVKAVLDSARKDAQRLADELMNKAKAEILADRQRLHREVELARDQALEAISRHTAELATLVASKALGRGVVIEDQNRLIQEAVAELGDGSRMRQKVGV